MRSKSGLVAVAALAFGVAVGGCSQPSQLPVPFAGRSQTALATENGFTASVTGRARFTFFAAIRSSRGGPGGFLGPGELGVYPAAANGNVAPAHVIAGRKTGLFEAGGCCVPQSAFFDSSGDALWTCRTFSKFVSVFPLNRGPGSWGDVKPAARLVISPQTVSCGGVALTKESEIVADDVNQGFVATWRAGSTGNAAPIRKIAGPATRLYLPSQITFDGMGDYIVSDRCGPPKCTAHYGGEILTFGPRADGNVAPLRWLAGSNTHLSGPNRIAYDPVHNLIYAANLDASTITAYPAGASGNVTPTIFIHGKKTQLWNPDAIAVDEAGYLYVGNEPLVPGPPPASILVFAPGANGNVAPVQVIQGSKTQLAEVNGIAVH
ncbi:MAG TPA: hypothetical protein VMF61_04040 [Candidatus Acidoferrales bacterium]|nr:hypothetical protein [Candidatus Acidoferrales bacterium]